MQDKKILIVGVIFVLAFFASVSIWLVRPSWHPIYPGMELSASAQNEIVGQLADWNIAYRFDEKSNLILVQDRDVIGVRNRLVELGLPSDSKPGMEMFANSDYGMSDYVKEINYQRATEVELERSIRELNGVRSARVHITMAKQSLFKDRQENSKGSVIIHPEAGVDLTKRMIVGIQEIVSKAVPELSPSDVSVVSKDGELLSSDSMVSEWSGSSTGDLEDQYKAVVEDLLGGLFLDADIKVGVNIHYDANRRTEVSEELVPAANGKGFLLKTNIAESIERSEESSDSQKSTTENSEYIYSRLKKETIKTAGEIKRVGIGLVVQYSEEVKFEETELRDLIASALSLDFKRGDKVAILLSRKLKKTNNSAESDQLSVPDEIQSQSEGKDGMSEEKPQSAIEGFINDNVRLFVYVLVSFFVILIFFVSLIGYLLITKGKAKSSDLGLKEREEVVREIKKWLEA